MKYVIDFKSHGIPLNEITSENANFYLNKPKYAKIVNVVNSEDYLLVNYSLNNSVRFFINKKKEDKLSNIGYLKNDMDDTSFSLFYPHRIFENRVILSKLSEDILFDYKTDSVYLKSKNERRLVTIESNPVIMIGYLK